MSFKSAILTWIDKTKENEEMCGRKKTPAAVCIYFLTKGFPFFSPFFGVFQLVR